MPDFSKGSTFNKDANFQGVMFGADAPLLETELNELQDIQTEARADIIRDSIPSGFVELGELDYDYMLNNENCVKLKTDSVAYVNGYKIKIPKGTIVDIGRAPEKDAREDLLFLEVWKEEVTKDSNLTIAGGEGQASTTNNILDSRVGQETARRVALKWRIRHVPNVDFNKYKDGLGKYYISSTYSHDFVSIAQGGLSEVPSVIIPTTSTEVLRMYHFYYFLDRQGSSLSSKQIALNDVGLFIAGDGSDKSKSTFKTVDGYVYAIPMFRIFRKPSCGKAIPFEYQKINPKVDYSKFANLIKEEKAERVTSETIGGRSLINLYSANTERSNYFAIDSSITLNSDNTITSVVNSNGYSNIQVAKDVLKLKVSTQYTAIVEILNTTFKSGHLALGETHQEGQFTSKFKSSKVIQTNKTGVFKVLLETKDSFNELTMDSRDYLVTPSSENGASITFRYMLLEGDWTNKEIPKYFTGLKSLSEDEGNLIEVKNGILDESSYDPDTGNVKLTTNKGITYLDYETEIPPIIEATLNRGEQKLSDVSNFNTLNTTQGDEIITFSKISGSTMQNLIQSTSGNVNKYYDVCSSYLTKPNTKYTIIFVNESEYNVSIYLNEHVFVGGGTPKSYPKGAHKVLATTQNVINSEVILKNGETNPQALSNIIMLEGDYTNIPLNQIPFISGISSVGQDTNNQITLKSNGKNLWKYLDLNKFKCDSYVDGVGLRVNIKLKPNTEYTCSSNCPYNTSSANLYFNGGKSSTDSVGLNNSKTSMSDSLGYISISIRFKEYNAGVTLEDFFNGKYWIQLEEGKSATQYEPYVSSVQTITLNAPLRSLPVGIKDEIIGNKIIRRVDEEVFVGGSNEDWREITDRHLTNTLYFEIPKKYNSHRSIRCSSLPTKLSGDSASVWTTDAEVCNYDNFWNMLAIRVNKDKLTSPNLAGFKLWLSKNPMTLTYGLVSDVEELIEPNYDKESIKTYQLDAPLRSLPNGVKDEIIGDKLIRRCGEVILDGNRSWKSYSEERHGENTYFAHTVVDNCKNYASFYNDRLPKQEDLWWNTCDIEGIHCHGVNATVQVRLAKSKVGGNTLNDYKQYLNKYPIKFVYELANPIEIPLKEVHSNTSNFSPQRQFSDGNWLRELPNGVKDTIENGKVIRRVGKAVINGTESSAKLTLAGVHSLFAEYKIDDASYGREFEVLSNNLPTTRIGVNDLKNPLGVSPTSHSAIRIRPIDKDNLTLDEIKTWLKENPLTILYELNAPVEEKLSLDNYMSYPYHELNTYCGSLYVGNGTNNVFVENGIGNDNVVIDTPFRSIKNKAIINDCKYKKSIDGYDTMYETSNFNLFDDSSYKGVVLNKITDFKFQPIDRLVPGTYSLRINFTDNSFVANSSVCVFMYNNNNPVLGFTTNGLLNVTSDICDKTNYLKLVVNSNGIASYGAKTIKDILLYKSDTLITEGEPYSKTEKAFENTESNDIDDLRYKVSLTGFNYDKILNESFDKLLRGEL